MTCIRYAQQYFNLNKTISIKKILLDEWKNPPLSHYILDEDFCR